MSARPIHSRYDDPLDLVWLECALACGFEIARSREVYASFDGRRTITLSTPDDFDADDSLAQMILHELCHAFVAGPAAWSTVDFGLDNTSERDLTSEHATHRLQAHLADRYGLRPLFAVTTQWRPYWDALPRDPLGPGDDPAIALARAARARADRPPFSAALARAFCRTLQLADVARRAAGPDSLWRLLPDRVHRRHRLGQPLGRLDQRCGTCAWGQGAMCEMTHPLLPTELRTVRPDEPACLQWEPALDASSCAECGACCHTAFHLVQVEAGEPIIDRHPHLLTPEATGRRESPFHIDRPGGFCRALTATSAPFLCGIYEDRPQSCRDFAVGSANCLEARRRVGLSPPG